MAVHSVRVYVEQMWPKGTCMSGRATFAHSVWIVFGVLIDIIPSILEGCLSRWSCHRGWPELATFMPLLCRRASLVCQDPRHLYKNALFLSFPPFEQLAFDKFKVFTTANSHLLILPVGLRCLFDLWTGRDDRAQVTKSNSSPDQKKGHGTNVKSIGKAVTICTLDGNC